MALAHQRIATGTSQIAPQGGQSDRSGPNFNFFRIPDGAISVVMPEGTSCSLAWDRPFQEDPTVVLVLRNGSSFPASKVEKGNDYYLARPFASPLGGFFVDFFGDFSA